MTKKIVYLTIDDGPAEDMKERVDFLEGKQIRAIWFCEGNKLEKFPDQAIYAISKGHIIGNHGYDHPNFSKISLEEAKNQIEKTDNIIEEFYLQAGISRPIKVFRFPDLNNGSKDEYEKTDWNNKKVKAIQNILADLGYKQPKFENINYEWFKSAGFEKCLNVDCSYDSFDYCLKEGVEELGYHDLATVLARIDEDVPDGGRGLNYPDLNEIIMMHAWIPIDAFKALINKILEKYIKFQLPNL